MHLLKGQVRHLLDELDVLCQACWSAPKQSWGFAYKLQHFSATDLQEHSQRKQHSTAQHGVANMKVQHSAHFTGQ